MNHQDIELARMIATNSNDIPGTIERLCDEVERLKNKEFDEDCAAEEAENFNYPALAMRTAAGPEVFHWPPIHIDAQFVGDALLNNPENFQLHCRAAMVASIIQFLRAADDMNRWKSVLFYGKDPNANGFHRDFTEIDDGFDPAKVSPQLIHAAFGIAAEAGELVEDAARAMCGEELDANINRESGDIDWYQELLALVTGQSTDTNRRQNIERLAKRFPEKFSESAAVERADEKE